VGANLRGARLSRAKLGDAERQQAARAGAELDVEGAVEGASTGL